ncbi:MAG: DHA2 family efflux MFS transporter permease subunit [Desulfobulbus sp.]|nr:DHA2 family efflux MFS transporter permease subunit [Desulfobulbus sp.]
MSSVTANKWLVAGAVMLPALLEVIDTSVANVALPNMQGSLNAGSDEVSWVLTSYLVSNAVVLPMTGWLARSFGRKRFLMACVVVFTLASLMCGAAVNLEMLIMCRIIQGAAGGALIPMSQAILLESFPANQQGLANAIFGVGVMFGPVIGPILGGWLTDTFSWRWIFYINFPLGAVALVMVGTFVEDPSYLKRTKESVDYGGLLLLTLGIGALQVVLDKGQQDDWFNSSFILLCSIVSVVSLALLVVVELRQRHPVVNLRLFKDLSFSAGNLVMFMVGFGLYGAISIIPLHLQSMMGYSATQSGMVLAPGGLATLIAMPIAAVLMRKVDGRKVVFFGLCCGAYSMFLLHTYSLQASFGDFIWPRIANGIGLACIFVPLTTITLGNIDKEKMGDASGLFNLLRNIGGSVGIAAATTLLARYSQANQNILITHATPYDSAYQEKVSTLLHGLLNRGYDLVSAQKISMLGIYTTIREQAGILAYNQTYWILGLAFLAVAPMLFLLRRPKEGQGPVAAH